MVNLNLETYILLNLIQNPLLTNLPNEYVTEITHFKFKLFIEISSVYLKNGH